MADENKDHFNQNIVKSEDEISNPAQTINISMADENKDHFNQNIVKSEDEISDHFDADEGGYYLSHSVMQGLIIETKNPDCGNISMTEKKDASYSPDVKSDIPQMSSLEAQTSNDTNLPPDTQTELTNSGSFDQHDQDKRSEQNKKSEMNKDIFKISYPGTNSYGRKTVFVYFSKTNNRISCVSYENSMTASGKDAKFGHEHCEGSSTIADKKDPEFGPEHDELGSTVADDQPSTSNIYYDLPKSQSVIDHLYACNTAVNRKKKKKIAENLRKKHKIADSKTQKRKYSERKRKAPYDTPIVKVIDSSSYQSEGHIWDQQGNFESHIDHLGHSDNCVSDVIEEVGMFVEVDPEAADQSSETRRPRLTPKQIAKIRLNKTTFKTRHANSKRFRCTVKNCKQIFLTVNRLNCHLKRHNQGGKGCRCLGCFKQGRSYRKINYSVSCDQCKGEMLIVISEHNALLEGLKDGLVGIHCGDCGADTISKVNQHVPDVMSTETHSVRNQKCIHQFFCAHDGCQVKQIKNFSYFLRHCQMHSYRPYLCPDCGEILKNYNVFCHHEASCKANQSHAESCPVCHKKYSNTATLKNHMRRTHKPKTKICDQCGKAFIINSDLRIHYRQMHSNMVKRKQNRSHVISSINQHAHDTHKKTCSVCGRIFTNFSRLKRHCEVHNPNRPHFPCDQCTKSFTRTSDLKHHIKNQHKMKALDAKLSM